MAVLPPIPALFSLPFPKDQPLNLYIFNNDTAFIEEYALEYFESDEEGDFVQGSDFDFAEAEKEF